MWNGEGTQPQKCPAISFRTGKSVVSNWIALRDPARPASHQPACVSERPSESNQASRHTQRDCQVEDRVPDQVVGEDSR